VDAGAAEVEVADDGLGMPPEVLGQVFDPFYQAPQGTDRALGGLGLGLAIVRSLVEMHGGTVRAESEGPGQGSRFIVRLPTIAPPDLAPAPAPTAAVREGAGKVLVVDDNQDAADTAAALLEMSGYDVRTAYEPQAALHTFDDFSPDVALLDIGLPGMSGYDLAAALRGHAHGRHCRLVALTGYGTQSDVERAMTAGFNAHLAKPAAPHQLLETVERLMADQAS
jgi:CheY-like chemotaxis protein